MQVAANEAKIQLGLRELAFQASWPVRITLVVLVVASITLWVITVLKFLQLRRLRNDALEFERAARHAPSAAVLFSLVDRVRNAPGARVVAELRSRATTNLERLQAAAERAVVDERKRARTLLSPLGTIASASPFIGLFGTVYGIMDAFVRIGAAKSASLPVVAPAIGEALVTTAIGLATAIPAVVFYNEIDRRIGEFIAELEASASEWVALIYSERETQAAAYAAAQTPLGSYPPPGRR